MMDVMKKIKPRMIFFFSNGVEVFLNRKLPSKRPVAIAPTTKNGKRKDSTCIVEDSIS